MCSLIDSGRINMQPKNICRRRQGSTSSMAVESKKFNFIFKIELLYNETFSHIYNVRLFLDRKNDLGYCPAAAAIDSE